MVKYSLLNRSCAANWTAKAILLCFTRLYILMQVVNHVEGECLVQYVKSKLYLDLHLFPFDKFTAGCV